MDQVGEKEKDQEKTEKEVIEKIVVEIAEIVDSVEVSGLFPFEALMFSLCFSNYQFFSFFEKKNYYFSFFYYFSFISRDRGDRYGGDRDRFAFCHFLRFFYVLGLLMKMI